MKPLDDNESFLQGVLPELKKPPPDIKPFIKLKTQQLMFEADAVVDWWISHIVFTCTEFIIHSCHEELVSPASHPIPVGIDSSTPWPLEGQAIRVMDVGPLHL